ncbi:MAG TPA: CvpA family protein [Burkholderiales bacterium]
MSAFDIAIVAVLVLSVAWGVWRGFVREILSLVGWVLAFLAANAVAGPLGDALPDALGSPEIRVLIAFVVVFVFVLSATTLAAQLLSRLFKAAGLGGVDRTLGALFGLARGVLILVAITLAAGLTAAPRHPLWKESVGAGMLTRTVQQLRPWLPPRLERRLRYD